MAISGNMRRLEELITGKSPGQVSYKGGALGTNLYSYADGAVQKAVLPEGSTFEPHSHSVTEVIVVLSGRLHVESPFLISTAGPGGVIIFPPGVEHSCYAETDCHLIGILVPRNGGYPDAR